MHLIIAWLVLTISVWVTAAILPGFRVNGLSGAIKAAAVFGILNWLLGYFFFVVLGIVTLGIGFLFAFLTRWLVMAIILKLADKLSSNINIDSFGTAALGALIMTVVGSLTEYGLHTLH